MFLVFYLSCIVIQFGYNVCWEDVLYEVELDQDPEKEVYYFAYGSNMLKNRIKRNVQQVRYRGIAVLKDYRLDFDSFVESLEGAVATVAKDPGAEVWGVLWGMSKADAGMFSSRQENSSKLYHHRYVKVYTPEMKERIAFTHVAKKPPKKLPPWQPLPKERRPSKFYLQILLTAATENNFPQSYIKLLLSIPNNTNQTDEIKHKNSSREALNFKVNFKL